MTDHLEKYRRSMADAERHDYDHDEVLANDLQTICYIADLRQIAGHIEVDTSGSKEELARRLVENGVFTGSASDGNVYHKDGDDATIVFTIGPGYVWH